MVNEWPASEFSPRLIVVTFLHLQISCCLSRLDPSIDYVMDDSYFRKYSVIRLQAKLRRQFCIYFRKFRENEVFQNDLYLFLIIVTNISTIGLYIGKIGCGL